MASTLTWPSSNAYMPSTVNLIESPLLSLQALKGRPTIEGRPGESLEPLDFEALKSKLQEEFGKYESLYQPASALITKRYVRDLKICSYLYIFNSVCVSMYLSLIEWKENF